MKRILGPFILLLLIPAVVFGQMYPNTHFVVVTPTIDTSIYASGDLIGTKLTFLGALRPNTSTGYLVSVAISDKAAQSSDLELVLFNADPTATTFTDQAPFDPADSDLAKVVAVISFGSAQRFAWADNGEKYIGSLVLPLGAQGTVLTTIYGALVSRGTPTFATSGDMTITIGVSQD